MLDADVLVAACATLLQAFEKLLMALLAVAASTAAYASSAISSSTTVAAVSAHAHAEASSGDASVVTKNKDTKGTKSGNIAEEEQAAAVCPRTPPGLDILLPLSYSACGRAVHWLRLLLPTALLLQPGVAYLMQVCMLSSCYTYRMHTSAPCLSQWFFMAHGYEVI